MEYYYQIIYYTYMLLMLGISLSLAIRTRKVKIEILNDSKWISAIVYIGVPVVFAFFLLTFVLASWVHLSAAVYCIGLFTISSIFLGLIFIPKVRVTDATLAVPQLITNTNHNTVFT